ncbi:Uncharacterised protein [Mycobacteroides abscessus subsp. abscessus]|nr:Uncharacterised protein [Mycobacteroides abscessus subsp. abscessus]
MPVRTHESLHPVNPLHIIDLEDAADFLMSKLDKMLSGHKTASFIINRNACRLKLRV